MDTNCPRSVPPRVEPDAASRCTQLLLQCVGIGRVTTYRTTVANTQPITVGTNQVELIATATTNAVVTLSRLWLSYVVALGHKALQHDCP